MSADWGTFVRYEDIRAMTAAVVDLFVEGEEETRRLMLILHKEVLVEIQRAGERLRRRDI